jgi:hypothetical protein
MPQISSISNEFIYSLRRFVAYACQGQLKRHYQEELVNQANCLTLVTNTITYWNTVYIQACLGFLDKEGYKFEPEDIEHLALCQLKHINSCGKIRFDIAKTIRLKGLQPLRHL